MSEEKSLKTIIGENNVYRIQHIGSTAVKGLMAKPTIDILLEIHEQTNVHELIKRMEDKGYIYSPQPDNPAPHIMFMKGYTTHGFRGQAFHIHIRYPGDWDEPYFRDYLIAHPEKAKEYEMLKVELAGKYKNDRDKYTNSKTNFINQCTQQQREWKNK